MRISTTMIYDLGVAGMNRQQAALVRTQQQLASGKRILAAEDDPVAAARAVQVNEAKAANAQYATNRQVASSKLSLMETVLQGVGGIIMNAKSIAGSAGNAALSDKDRASLGVELRAQFDALVGLANSTDEAGHHLFAGNRVTAVPFAPGAGGIVYSGDQGGRMVQVNDSRQIPVTEAGSEVFERIRNGNGTFVTAPVAANTGTGIVSAGTVVDPTALNGHSYEITFSVAAGVTTYAVTDTTTATVVSTGTPYVAGQAITVAGMRTEISGAPANTDRFTLAPSTSESVFATIDKLITLVSTPLTDAASSARLTNGLAAAMQNLDQAFDNVLRVRSSVGGRLQELDTLQTAGDALATQHEQTLSQLLDVDYAKGTSDLARQQLCLEAAQQSFARIAGLSLFEFL